MEWCIATGVSLQTISLRIVSRCFHERESSIYATRKRKVSNSGVYNEMHLMLKSGGDNTRSTAWLSDVRLDVLC